MLNKLQASLKWARRRLTWLCDRIIDGCGLILQDEVRLSPPPLQHMAQRLARVAARVCWLVRDFPRVSVYELTGQDWNIRFVGWKRDALVAAHLFFPEIAPMPRDVGRVALWNLTREAGRWLREGSDLVICQQVLGSPFRVQAPISFAVPPRVEQYLELTGTAESLIEGRRKQPYRSMIHRAASNGFDWRFSRTEADLAFFYQRMYLPFMKDRHQDLAVVMGYKELKRLYRYGGLILVTQHGQPVAGTVLAIIDGVCYGIIEGVLDADPDLFQKRVNTLLYWYAILWAKEHGVNVCHMGASHGWTSHGPFDYKARWGARTVPHRSLNYSWIFLAQSFSPVHRERLNTLGLLCSIKGRFYRVILVTEAPIEDETWDFWLVEAARDGIDGLLAISEDGASRILPVAAAEHRGGLAHKGESCVGS